MKTLNPHAFSAAGPSPIRGDCRHCGEGIGHENHEPPTWHVVTSQGGRVLGVFGAKILSMAQECAAKVEHETGFPAFVHQVRSHTRPVCS